MKSAAPSMANLDQINVEWMNGRRRHRSQGCQH
jgi:hypothetical protein